MASNYDSCEVWRRESEQAARNVLRIWHETKCSLKAAGLQLFIRKLEETKINERFEKKKLIRFFPKQTKRKKTKIKSFFFLGDALCTIFNLVKQL